MRTLKSTGFSTAFYYGSISLFSTILHNVFLIYHIEMFISVFAIDKVSFWAGETIFLLWNSVNDPLFGWFGDRNEIDASSKKDSSQLFQLEGVENTGQTETKSRQTGASPSIIVQRTKVITFCGPLLALSFTAFWFNWQLPSIQFATCLCVYDAFLTIIDLEQSALLADLSITTEERTNMNSYESIFSAIGSISVFLSYRLFDKQSLMGFQLLCVCIATFSAVGFYTASRLLRDSFLRDVAPNVRPRREIKTRPKSGSTSQQKSLKTYLRQLLSHKNFLTFTIINIIQVFHCHFNSNFFPLFMEALVEDHKHYGSFLIGISFVIPHMNNILFLRMSNHYGVYSVIRLLFALKLVLSLVMISAGMSHGWLMCFFIASNRVCTEGTCKLLNLVITDLVDEDYVRNDRSEPISMLIFGTANFLAKPGQTLAPIIGTSLISAMTGQEIFSSLTKPVGGINHSPHYKESCFQILVYIPLVCGALQLIAWSFFKLHGTHLQRIKSVRSNLQYLLTV